MSTATTQIPVLECQVRAETGGRLKNRRLRDGGRIPAIICGRGEATVSVTVDHKTLFSMLTHGTRVFELAVGEQRVPSKIHDLQYDVFGEALVHADFLRIDLSEEIEVNVHVELFGEALGAAQGGVVTTQMAHVPLMVSPLNIPHALEVNVTKLGLDEEILVGDLKLPEGCRLSEDVDPEDVVVLCRSVAQEEESMPADFDAAPEVIGRKPGEEGEDA